MVRVVDSEDSICNNNQITRPILNEEIIGQPLSSIKKVVVEHGVISVFTEDREVHMGVYKQLGSPRNSLEVCSAGTGGWATNLHRGRPMKNGMMTHSNYVYSCMRTLHDD